MFPIIDVKGNVIAFGGRVMDDSKPKYLNSSDTVIFRKGKQLFALNYAKDVLLGNIVSELVKPGDKIAVCISGGKDSMLMAKLFQELKRHNKFDFEVQFLVMDPGYSPENRKVIESNAKLMNIPMEALFENTDNTEHG